MHEWKESYGTFRIEGSDCHSKKTVQILGNHTRTPMNGEEMVHIALKFAKQHKCRIVTPVSYQPTELGGKLTFEIECDRKSSRTIYLYGTGHYSSLNPIIKDRDFKQYQEAFNTKVALHPDFKKQYWFKDNWNGEIHYFNTQKEAENAAANAYGYTVYIYTNQPYGRPTKLVKRVTASECVYP